MLDKSFKIAVSVFCTAWLFLNVVAPAVTLAVLYDDYMNLVSECGQAMDSAWYTSQLELPNLNKSEQIQLLHCHEYDKVRKILLVSGVSENVLSYFGLVALELHQREATELTEQHRFTER